MSEQQPHPSGQSLNISGSVLESVQIGGVAGRDLNLNQIQGGVGVINVFGSVQVDRAPISATQPISREEYRWRRLLLDQVKRSWINGVLAKSLHAQVLIELGLEERSKFVQNPLSEVEEFPSDSKQAFPAGTAAADIFEGIGAGRTLLILGEPGSGKTVTLLKLTESLVARTENDLSLSLPIVLNLSSWAKKRQSIADWLVIELHEIYGVSKSLVKAWVDQDQLILLLDGLDEVDAKYRNDCVKALNQFIQKHGLTEMVVCSRIRDYEALSERLILRSAIYVQPLTFEQIDQYLEQAGDQLTVLKEILNKKVDIKSLASSPLVLSIMSLAYQGCSLDALQTITTADTFHQRLFDVYINRMLTRRGTTQQYSQKQTKRWLTWLSQRMSQESQTVFFIERMQPSWLHIRLQRIQYHLGNALTSGLIVGLIVGLIFGLNFNLQFGLEVGLIVGLIGMLIGGLIDVFIGNINTVETFKWSWKEARRASLNGLIVGLLAGLLVWLLYGLLVWLSLAETELPLIAALLHSSTLALPFGLIVGLIVGMIGSFRGPEIQKKFKPNQGVWKSAQNALIFALIVGLLAGLFGLIFGPGLFLGGVLGLIGGLVGWFVGGGTTCLRHFTLRLMLSRMRYIPWNYVRFLDYAADRLFMQKVGGGYIFVHRMLMEHFAQMDL